MPIKKKKTGFTIIEVLVSFIIIAVVSLSLIGMQSSFSKSTYSRTITTALSDVAQSAMAQCKAGIVPPNTFTYYIPSFDSSGTSGSGKINITIQRTGNCSGIAANTCQDVEIKASSGLRSFTLKSNICNFN